jgi:hypothetical protein
MSKLSIVLVSNSTNQQIKWILPSIINWRTQNSTLSSVSSKWMMNLKNITLTCNRWAKFVSTLQSCIKLRIWLRLPASHFLLKAPETSNGIACYKCQACAEGRSFSEKCHLISPSSLLLAFSRPSEDFIFLCSQLVRRYGQPWRHLLHGEFIIPSLYNLFVDLDAPLRFAVFVT